MAAFSQYPATIQARPPRSLPNQCDQAFIAAAIPLLSPANVSEILRFGLIGIALSRYAGTWTGLKTVADTVECTATIAVDPDEPRIMLPNDFELPPQGLGARWPDDRWGQDARLLNLRLPAAKAFARANALDEVVFGGRGTRRLAIVTSGKAYGDVRQALAQLGIDEAVAIALGIVIYKVGMVWPLEPKCIRDVLDGVDEVIVVEERRAVLEPQIKDLAYNWPADRRPRIVGKTDERGVPLLPESGELSPSIVALALGKRLGRFAPPAPVIERLEVIERQHDGNPARAQPNPCCSFLRRLPACRFNARPRRQCRDRRHRLPLAALVDARQQDRTLAADGR